MKMPHLYRGKPKFPDPSLVNYFYLDLEVQILKENEMNQAIGVYTTQSIYQNKKLELRRLLESVNQTKMQLGESFSSKEISVQPNKANYIALYMLLVIVGGV